MPHLRSPISPQGPIVDFLVGVSRPQADLLKSVGKPVPPPIAVRGLIDTGASITAIVPAVLSPLSLTPTGRVPVLTPSGEHDCDQYDVSLTFPLAGYTYTLSATPIIETPKLAAQGLQALIGRSVLDLAVLIYDGSGGSFTLGF